jgi:hypothetical protein
MIFKQLIFIYLVLLTAIQAEEERKLIKVVSVLRHGARAPLNVGRPYFIFKEQYNSTEWIGVQIGGLTKKGAR